MPAVIDLDPVQRLAVPGLKITALKREVRPAPGGETTWPFPSNVSDVIVQFHPEALEIASGIVLGLATRLALEHAQQVIGIVQCGPLLVQLDPVTADQRQVGPLAVDRLGIQLVRQVHRPRGLLDLHPVLLERRHVLIPVPIGCLPGRHNCRNRNGSLVGEQLQPGGQSAPPGKSAGQDHSDREREIPFACVGKRHQDDALLSGHVRIDRPRLIAADRHGQHPGHPGDPDRQELLRAVADRVNDLGPPAAIRRQYRHQLRQLHLRGCLPQSLGPRVIPHRHRRPRQHPPHPRRLVVQRRIDTDLQSPQVILLDPLDTGFVPQLQRTGGLVDQDHVPLLGLHRLVGHRGFSLVAAVGDRLFEDDLRRRNGRRAGRGRWQSGLCDQEQPFAGRLPERDNPANRTGLVVIDGQRTDLTDPRVAESQVVLQPAGCREYEFVGGGLGDLPRQRQRMVDQRIGDGDQGNDRGLHSRHRPLDRQHDGIGRDLARDKSKPCLAGVELSEFRSGGGRIDRPPPAPVGDSRRECLVQPHHRLAGQPPHAQWTRQTELEFLDVG